MFNKNSVWPYVIGVSAVAGGLALASSMKKSGTTTNGGGTIDPNTNQANLLAELGMKLTAARQVPPGVTEAEFRDLIARMRAAGLTPQANQTEANLPVILGHPV